jgi:hypothetical protein
MEELDQLTGEWIKEHARKEMIDLFAEAGAAAALRGGSECIGC